MKQGIYYSHTVFSTENQYIKINEIWQALARSNEITEVNIVLLAFLFPVKPRLRNKGKIF